MRNQVWQYWRVVASEGVQSVVKAHENSNAIYIYIYLFNDILRVICIYDNINILCECMEILRYTVQHN